MYIKENKVALATELEDISRGEWSREMNRRDHFHDLEKLNTRIKRASKKVQEHSWNDYEDNNLVSITIETDRYGTMAHEAPWSETFISDEAIANLCKGLWLREDYESRCTGYDGYGSHRIVFSR